MAYHQQTHFGALLNPDFHSAYMQQGQAAPLPAIHSNEPVSFEEPSPLTKDDIELIIRQQPMEALVAASGKEKNRKPVDPPPIIQMRTKGQADPLNHCWSSPYIFMMASLVPVEGEDTLTESEGKPVLTGSLVSTIHRLKDTNNQDSGFFVFGDISVKIQGNFRLNFSLFTLNKTSTHTFEQHCQHATYLGEVISKPFKVMPPKDYKGLMESTHLSRAFSEQGVRLRLRKEARAVGRKRTYQEYGDGQQEVTPPEQRYSPAAPQYQEHTPHQQYTHQPQYPTYAPQQQLSLPHHTMNPRSHSRYPDPQVSQQFVDSLSAGTYDEPPQSFNPSDSLPQPSVDANDVVIGSNYAADYWTSIMGQGSGR